MWTTTGFWCDASFTSSRLLEEIANQSSLAATGALTNPNLTGAAYLRVLGKATFTAQTVADAGQFLLTRGRTVEEQVAMVRAAAAKSPRAVELLVSALSADAALRLWRIVATERFRGAAAVADAIRRSATSVYYRAQSDTDAYRDLIAALIAELGIEVGQETLNGELAAAWAAACRTADELRAVSRYFPRIGDGCGYSANVCDQLLLATLDHPEVVADWARSGDVGAIIAAGDDRLDPAILGSLRAQVPAATRMIETRLETNPGAAALDAERVERLIAEVSQLLRTNPAGAVDDLEDWYLRAEEQLNKTATDIAGPISAMENPRHLDSLIGGYGHMQVPLFQAVRVFLNPNASPAARNRLVRMLAWPIPHSVLVKLAVRDPGLWDSQLLWDRAPLFGVKTTRLPSAEDVTDDRAARTVRGWASRVCHKQACGQVSPAAPYLAARLTSIGQVTRVQELMVDANRHHTTLFQLVEQALEEAVDAIDANGYADLIGNALGALD